MNPTSTSVLSFCAAAVCSAAGVVIYWQADLAVAALGPGAPSALLLAARLALVFTLVPAVGTVVLGSALWRTLRRQTGSPGESAGPLGPSTLPGEMAQDRVEIRHDSPLAAAEEDAAAAHGTSATPATMNHHVWTPLDRLIGTTGHLSESDRDRAAASVAIRTVDESPRDIVTDGMGASTTEVGTPEFGSGSSALRQTLGEALRADPSVVHPRIVAITADATHERRGACAAAGMDGFLSRPPDREALTEMLARLAAEAAEVHRAEPSDPPPTGRPPEAPSVAFPTLLAAADGLHALYDDLLLATRDGLRDELAAFRAALQADDLAAAARRGHTLQTLAALLGEATLFDLSQKARQASDERTCAEAVYAFLPLHAETKAVLARLDAAIAELAPPPVPAPAMAFA